MNHFSISIHPRLHSIVPAKHMASPKDAKWEKKVVSENIALFFIQKSKLSAPGQDGVSMANAVSAPTV